mmetsp:Transcript_11491/g.18895  ORF Transcript_11491/g.18895 Transcript_11491/m.18895 type:complete len:539 (+) Transcript_11491:41-1657(+)
MDLPSSKRSASGHADDIPRKSANERGHHRDRDGEQEKDYSGRREERRKHGDRDRDRDRRRRDRERDRNGDRERSSKGEKRRRGKGENKNEDAKDDDDDLGKGESGSKKLTDHRNKDSSSSREQRDRGGGGGGGERERSRKESSRSSRRRRRNDRDRRRRRRRSPSESESESDSTSSSEEEQKRKKKRKSNFGPKPVIPEATGKQAAAAAAAAIAAKIGANTATTPTTNDPRILAGISGSSMPNLIGGGALMAAQLMAAQNVQMATVNPEVTRQARRLYIGNLPVSMGLTNDMLMNFFSQTVASLGITTKHPIVSVWISQQGTFCFVEFRSVQDANNAMTLLNGLSLGGRLLRIGRPADYKPVPAHLANYVAPIPPNLSQAFAMQQQQMQKQRAATNLEGGQRSNATTNQGGEATPVLLLLNMVTASELIDDDEYNDIRNQVGTECEKFGQVLSVIIPRPNQNIGDDDAEDDEDDDDDDDDEKAVDTQAGVGRIFVRYANQEQARVARTKLHGRQFGGNRVECRFYPVDKLQAADYTFS